MFIHSTLFRNLKQMADGIVTMFGHNCEVAIHDLVNLQKSLIYLAGNVTGRKPGAPATDLLVRALQQDHDDLKDMHNYRTETHDGRAIKSSTIFIRDSQNRIVAAFCINFDTTDFFNAAHALAPFINDTRTEGHSISETFALTAGDTINALFDQALTELGKQPASMTLEEKIRLVALLENQGLFAMKGAVQEVAGLMGVSKFTIYNYLKKIRENTTKTKGEADERAYLN